MLRHSPVALALVATVSSQAHKAMVSAMVVALSRWKQQTTQRPSLQLLVVAVVFIAVLAMELKHLKVVWKALNRICLWVLP
jgi:hypothetical protein